MSFSFLRFDVFTFPPSSTIAFLTLLNTRRFHFLSQKPTQMTKAKKALLFVFVLFLYYLYYLTIEHRMDGWDVSREDWIVLKWNYT